MNVPTSHVDTKKCKIMLRNDDFRCFLAKGRGIWVGWPKHTLAHPHKKFEHDTKDSFLRALREVAPEMELFLENHGQYIKKL